MNKYGTTNSVLIEARVHHDPYDEFAWVQDWRFAIAEYLTHYRGVEVPEFRSAYDGGDPGVMRDESFAFDTLWSANPQTESLTYALKILGRYREWLRIAGRDY